MDSSIKIWIFPLGTCTSLFLFQIYCMVSIYCMVFLFNITLGPMLTGKNESTLHTLTMQSNNGNRVIPLHNRFLHDKKRRKTWLKLHIIVEFLPRGLHNWIPPKYPLSSLSCLCSQKRSTGNNSWFLTFKSFQFFFLELIICVLLSNRKESVKFTTMLTIHKIHTKQFKVRFLFSSFALYIFFKVFYTCQMCMHFSSFFLNHHIFFRGGGSFKVLRYDTIRIFWNANQFKLIYSKYWTTVII